MLQDIARATATMIEVLPKQRADLAAGKVDNRGCPREVDAESIRSQSYVELCILVPAKRLVVAADRLVGLDAHQRMMAMIDETARGSGAVRGSAVAEHRVL